MYNKDAKELKGYIPYGTKVTIVKGPYGPFGEGFRTLKPGNIGSDVFAIQRKLKELGYYNGWCDGKYGEQMTTAIYKFEDANNLPRTYYITESLYQHLGFIQYE